MLVCAPLVQVKPCNTVYLCMAAGEKMMVPLTESLYVEGFVHQKDKILVDIGTGYFAEVRAAEPCIHLQT